MKTPEVILGVYRALGGFPLRSVKDARDGVVSHVRTTSLVAWSVALHCVFVFAPFLVLLPMLGSDRFGPVVESGFRFGESNAARLGITRTEQATIVVVVAVGVVAALASLSLVARSGPELSALNRLLHDFARRCDALLSDVTSRTRRRLAVLYLVSAPIPLLAFANVYSFFGDDVDRLGRVLVALMAALVSLGFVLPSIAVCFVLQSYYLDAAATMAEAFRRNRVASPNRSLDNTITSRLFRTPKSTLDSGSKPKKANLDDLVDLGNDLMDVVECLNEAFGGLTTLEVLADVSLVTIGVFLFSSLFTGELHRLSDPVDRFYFSCLPLMGLCIALTCLYRLWTVCRSGQKLQTQLGGAAAALTEVAIGAARASSGGLGPARELEHRALMDRVRFGATLAPKDYFQLNNGLFSAAFATLVNYLLVLIAFKIDTSS